jgi:hypothetical protein
MLVVQEEALMVVAVEMELLQLLVVVRNLMAAEVLVLLRDMVVVVVQVVVEHLMWLDQEILAAEEVQK